MVEATVVVLTYNGEEHIREIIEAVLGQRYGSFELLVIDSGSTDATLEIVRSFPAVRLVEIPNSEFGHGRTRNLAAQYAQGKYIAYLTHDAVPTTPHWLERLIEPLEKFPDVAGVVGKQVPRYDAFPLQKYDIEAVFSGQGPDHGITISRGADSTNESNNMDLVTFYSDVNSATRTEFLREEIPYRDVPYAEDQLFAKDFVAAGFAKAYAPLAQVIHSNRLTVREYGPRIFDEFVGLRRIGVHMDHIRWFSAFKGAFFGAARQEVAIACDPRFSMKRKVYWLFLNPAYHFKKSFAIRRAANVDLDDSNLIANHSLESMKRSA